jgi:hypothetical protein
MQGRNLRGERFGAILALTFYQFALGNISSKSVAIESRKFGQSGWIAA